MENHLRAASLIANLLDNKFNFFGHRFGLNGLLGLIPGAGDIIVAALAFYLVWIGLQLKIPFIKIIEMIANIAFDFFIGLIPVIGDAADFFQKANLRNLKILQEHSKKHVIEGEVLESVHPVTFR